MNSKPVLCAIVAASLLSGPLAIAQDAPFAIRDRNDQGQGQRGERGVGPDHSYYRGERLPPQYRTRHYIVEDWRGHHLSAPPRGYQWVQSGGDYVLVAIATGIILQLLLNN